MFNAKCNTRKVGPHAAMLTLVIVFSHSFSERTAELQMSTPKLASLTVAVDFSGRSFSPPPAPSERMPDCASEGFHLGAHSSSAAGEADRAATLPSASRCSVAAGAAAAETGGAAARSAAPAPTAGRSAALVPLPQSSQRRRC